MIYVFTHNEVGFDPASQSHVDAIQIACEYLMDMYYPSHSEDDVIKGYTSDHIAVLSDTIVIEVKNVYHECTMH